MTFNYRAGDAKHKWSARDADLVASIRGIRPCKKVREDLEKFPRSLFVYNPLVDTGTRLMSQLAAPLIRIRGSPLRLNDLNELSSNISSIR